MIIQKGFEKLVLKLLVAILYRVSSNSDAQKGYRALKDEVKNYIDVRDTYS